MVLHFMSDSNLHSGASAYSNSRKSAHNSRNRFLVSFGYTYFFLVNNRDDDVTTHKCETGRKLELSPWPYRDRGSIVSHVRETVSRICLMRLCAALARGRALLLRAPARAGLVFAENIHSGGDTATPTRAESPTSRKVLVPTRRARLEYINYIVHHVATAAPSLNPSRCERSLDFILRITLFQMPQDAFPSRDLSLSGSSRCSSQPPLH